MSTALVPERLEDISPHAFQHPADRAATAALSSVPMLDVVVKTLVELQYERAYRQSFLAASVKVGPNQLGDVHRLWERVLQRLDMDDQTFDVYVTQHPTINALAIGTGKPMVVIHSRTLDVLDEDELLTVLGHEAGHILSDHVLYRTATLILLQLVNGPRIPALAGLPLRAVLAALLEWYRASELSCDRAATLVNHDPLVTCRTLMAIAAGLPSSRLDVNAFLVQAKDYAEWDSNWDRLGRWWQELWMTHSYPVKRATEVRAWVEGGEYNRIVGGEYRRKSDPVDPKLEAGGAVEFYSERFKAIFNEASEQVKGTGGKAADWVRNRQGGSGDA